METDARAELRDLLRSARALVEMHREAGTTGLPEAERRARAEEAPRPASHASTTASSSEAPAEARPRPAPTPPSSRVRAPASREEAKVRLATLADEVRACTRCVLHEQRTQTVFARGNPEAELCFVGEGPGADEDAQGLPFVGKAGQLLDRMIVAMGYAPDDVYVCNVVKCRPPNNRKPEPDEMAACLPFVGEQIALVQPKVIVALGATAAQGLFGAPISITRARGQWRLYRGTIPVMPTFHPAYLLRTPAAKREVWQDLRAVLEKLGKPVPARST